MKLRRRRPALRHQPRGRVLRRGARHRREDQSERDGHRSRRTRSSPTARRTDDGDVWWEGMTDEPPAHLMDWHGNDWTPGLRARRRRIRTRASRPRRPQCPSMAPEWEDPAGVPIDAFLFGGRRATVVPLVREAFDWEHGVFLGSIMSLGDHRRRRRRGGQAPPRPDGDAALLRVRHGRLLRALDRDRARATGANLPRIFYVNWFRKDDDGQLPLARLRREQPRAGLDLPPLRRRGRGGRDADRRRARRRGAARRRASTSRASDLARS